MMAIASNISGLFSLLGEELLIRGLYFENEQGGAIDNMGGTSGGDASSDYHASAHARIAT